MISRCEVPNTVCLALTGASGMPYGIRLLECLLAAGCRVQLLYSQVAQIVARQEMGLELPARASETGDYLRATYAALPGKLDVYGREEWFAPLASGSNPPDAMVVCPCTMGRLAAIAQGLASNLIERAADVVLKEGRKLILVPRETPLSAIHLENMLRLARAALGHRAPPNCPGGKLNSVRRKQKGRPAYRRAALSSLIGERLYAASAAASAGRRIR